MKKLFTKNLCIYMALAMVIAITAIFSYQTYSCRISNTASSYEKLNSVKEKLISNEAEKQELSDTLDKNSLAKARAFAHMIELDPSIIESTATMQKVAELLDVDEVHVTDEKGILWWGNVEGFYGFDFSTGDQTRPLLAILDDPALEIAQEPQPNSATGALFQYISVPRQDSTGIVQVGLSPDVLQNMVDSTTIDKVLRDFDFMNTGHVFALNITDQTVAYTKNENLIGTNYTEAGFPDSILSGGEGTMKIDGVKCFYVAQVQDNLLIGTMLPTKEYYQVRTTLMLIVTITLLVIFLALIFLINNLVSKKIVDGIREIAGKLELIASGNLETRVDVKGNPEFELLSSKINQMVQETKDNLTHNQQLLEKQKEDMESSLSLINNIRKACENLDYVSSETLKIAHTINSGTTDQENAVAELSKNMDRLTAKLKDSANVSQDMSKASATLVQNMMGTKNKMLLLTDSMDEITNTSNQIEKIIEEIDSIASQTNMLSLNASIEAARAGDSGRGFAVVASQVGELAFRSTEAAKETNQLIENSIKAVKNGQIIANQVVEEFLKVVLEIEKTGEDVDRLTSMVNEQFSSINEAVADLTRISSVTEKNSAISVTSESNSENLAEEAKKLRELVER